MRERHKDITTRRIPRIVSRDDRRDADLVTPVLMGRGTPFDVLVTFVRLIATEIKERYDDVWLEYVSAFLTYDLLIPYADMSMSISPCVVIFFRTLEKTGFALQCKFQFCLIRCTSSTMIQHETAISRYGYNCSG